jgi:hypothetical protein
LVPTGTNGLLSTRKFGIGPTVVVVEHKGHTNIGLLANHVWSVPGSDNHPYVSTNLCATLRGLYDHESLDLRHDFL